MNWRELAPGAATCFGLLMGFGASAAAQDAYFGFDLDRMAQAFAKQGALRAEYGEGAFEAHFESYLQQEMGSDTETFWQAWNAWWDRFRADDTGRLEAEYLPIQHQKVPQRVMLRTQMDTFAAAVAELERELAGW